MKVTLTWQGNELMFGPFAIATVREATRFTGNHASFTVAGKMPVHVKPNGSMADTNEAARFEAESAVIAGLRECGIEAEVAK